ncbi:ABC transporter ATP-binding protein [Rhizosphaericola mali]|uniref:ABC transporter ATP-binding protein n=1 Tax=Rhizosphaericola mali TaxID=2545455 RepID=A0A5P2GAP6_9BACT|nr:ATP-binding cassette domain-containing protein [Rhizosphaericola mali]QES90770.1 ABC transporter ATP-binding protein [Rhizosphaericola mali]
MALVELHNLKKYYATQKAVDDISLSIAEGSIFGLLGPNGAGKTTLLRMITGIFQPDEGEVIIAGKKFDPIEDVRLIGYMPEERGLYKKMKIGEQALYLAQLKGLSKSEALESAKYWFSRLKMESWWDKKLEDLSKGMGQKLQFVVTVMHSPKLIILDEPFSGLDPVNAGLIKDEIFNLAQQGSTIIFSTHRMEQVEEICDHIALVNQGKVLLDGTVDSVKQQFKENIWELKFQGNASLITNNSFEIIQQSGDRLYLKIQEGANENSILQYLIQEGVLVKGFNEILPSLNDIFIHLVEGTNSVTRSFES